MPLYLLTLSNVNEVQKTFEANRWIFPFIFLIFVDYMYIIKKILHSFLEMKKY